MPLAFFRYYLFHISFHSLIRYIFFSLSLRFIDIAFHIFIDFDIFAITISPPLLPFRHFRFAILLFSVIS
jgi:hypothetical protein